MPDSIKSTTAETRHTLAMQWLRFYYQHPAGADVDTADKNADAYVEQHG